MLILIFLQDLTFFLTSLRSVRPVNKTTHVLAWWWKASEAVQRKLSKVFKFNTKLRNDIYLE